MSERKTNRLIMGLILLLGFALRVHHLLHVSPIADEYITMLATRATLRWGYPKLPSGLYYEHGLLFTYLDALFVLVFGFDQIMTRVPSLVFGLLTVATVYKAGRQWFSARAGLMAAAWMALLPLSIVWGARARMYSLWIWLFFLATFWLASGLLVRNSKLFRCLGVVALMVSAFSHVLSLGFAVPLAVALVAGWFTTRSHKSEPVRIRDVVWPESLLSTLGILSVLMVRRMGDCPDLTGRATLSHFQLANPVALFARAMMYLSPFFRPPMVVTSLLVVTGVLFLVLRLTRSSELRDTILLCLILFFIGGVFGLGIVSRYHSDRYVSVLIPVFALIVGRELATVGDLLGQRTTRLVGLAAPLLLLVGSLGPAACATATRDSINIDQAYAFVRRNRSPEDVVVTTSPAAATICLGGSDIYISADSDGPCTERRDRWTGIPHYTCSEDFATLLDKEARVWFVVDDWFWEHSLSTELRDLIQTHMDLAFHPDGARVYLHHE
jgi:4-amino-4-deoxy-L-arabinose transferase-like glycosyltransferase